MANPLGTVTFDYEDFHFHITTRSPADIRRHGEAKVFADPDGGVYLYGPLGCSKTRETVREALVDLLGGRRLLAHRVY